MHVERAFTDVHIDICISTHQHRDPHYHPNVNFQYGSFSRVDERQRSFLSGPHALRVQIARGLGTICSLWGPLQVFLLDLEPQIKPYTPKAGHRTDGLDPSDLARLAACGAGG